MTRGMGGKGLRNYRRNVLQPSCVNPDVEYAAVFAVSCIKL